MVAQTSWASEASTVNPSASFETKDTMSAKVALDNYVFRGSGLPTIIGTSAALGRVLSMVRVVAPTDSTVLINGETGTGKELIAEAIHKCSHRSNGPFVKVNCAAIPAGLLESELFGHERGAYTGAVARGIGRFERAHRGTLFLDEIGDLPLELQPKLLRVMQERQFERLGGAATIHADVRVICATHRNLLEMINERQFRADLFYRLGVFPIALPPLRERPEDILLLARHFAMAYGVRMRKRITAISEEFIAVLARHSWPGNVRELQNLIERSVILSTDQVLSGSLPELTRARPDGSPWSETFKPATLENAQRSHDQVLSGSLPELTRARPDGSPWSETFKPVTLENAQRSHILKTLHQTKGRIGGRDGAAARLGLPRTTLIHRMKRLGIIVAPVATSESIPRMPPHLQETPRRTLTWEESARWPKRK
jgi:formate hydrogenlyase transcriptional activator